MLGEVVVLAMLEYEDSILVEHVTVEHQVRNLRQFFQCVRRVGEDEVVFLVVALQKAEHVASDQDVLVLANFFETLADEVGMVTVSFYAHHLLAAT